MSNQIPQFRRQDRVRMMQTPVAAMTGLANKRGTVVEVHPDGSVMTDFGDYGQIRCNAADLMLIPEETIVSPQPDGRSFLVTLRPEDHAVIGRYRHAHPESDTATVFWLAITAGIEDLNKRVV